MADPVTGASLPLKVDLSRHPCRHIGLCLAALTNSRQLPPILPLLLPIQMRTTLGLQRTNRELAEGMGNAVLGRLR